MNPILPIDILEELNGDENDEEKEKLQKENEKLKGRKTLKRGPGPLRNSNSSNNSSNNNNNNKKDEGDEKNTKNKTWEKFKSFSFKCFESAGITFASLFILGCAGVFYHRAYRAHVVNKMEKAFDKGDPAFELTMHNRTNNAGKEWVERPQQHLLDEIVRGDIRGRYFLMVGEKGTGKTSMILEAMRKVSGFNCTFFDAHADPEIFRIRLGRALNFEYHEDYIGSLFSIRGPRDTTAILDIERAFNKLEEVAVSRVKKTGKPLVLVINNAHLIRDDVDGVNLVELLQQKAESLSGSGLATMVFNSDDYWLYERLKKLGTRLEVINVRDLSRSDAIQALKLTRQKSFQESVDDAKAEEVFELIGGRPQHLAYVSGHRDMITACHEIIDREKTWLLNQCTLLGEDMDDDVMEGGKFSTSAFLLVRELVKLDRKRMAAKVFPKDHHHLPELPLWRANQVMTRSDYIQKYDALNIFTIDSHSRVRADSVPMMRAFHEIASQPGFNELLEETCARVAAIESLGRTRELVAKDLIQGNSYNIIGGGSGKNNTNTEISFINKEKIYRKVFDNDGNIIKIVPDGENNDDDDETISMEDIDKDRNRKIWWRKRMQALGTTYIPDGYMYAENDSVENDLDVNREQKEKEEKEEVEEKE